MRPKVLIRVSTPLMVNLLCGAFNETNSAGLRYDLDVPAEKFCDDLLDQKGVLVCHGDCFYIPHSFRITLSHGEQLEEGLRLIDEYIDELVAQGKSI